MSPLDSGAESADSPEGPKTELKPESTPPSPDLNDLSSTGLLKLVDWLHDIDPNDEHLDFLTEFLRNMGEGKGEDQGALDTIGKTADWLGSIHIGEWQGIERDGRDCQFLCSTSLAHPRCRRQTICPPAHR